jgi:hypothetical protein
MITMSDGMSICVHPDAVRHAVPARTVTRYRRRTTAPVRGMIRRVSVRTPGYFRTVCPDCGAWAVALFWPPRLPVTLVSTGTRPLTDREKITP